MTSAYGIVVWVSAVICCSYAVCVGASPELLGHEKHRHTRDPAVLAKELAELKQQLHPSSQLPSPVSPLSAFVVKDRTVTLDTGKVLTVDEILYGYDLLFEHNHLFSLGSWLGVQCQQDPSDAFVLQQLIWDIQPKVIIDIGTNAGGGAAFFASIMSFYSTPGDSVVVTIDPEPLRNWDKETAKLCKTCRKEPTELQVWQDYVYLIKGRSVAKEVLEEVETILEQYTKGGGAVIVSVDGSHDYQAVLADLEAYSKFVTRGSYMVSQDTKLDRLQNRDGPLKATLDFLADYPDFESDRSQEVFWFTHHPQGFLKRVT